MDTPNEHINRSILMFAFLLQGDMEKTYCYMKWYDGWSGAIIEVASTIAEIRGKP